MARGEHSPACARRWREQAEARQWTTWQTVQAIHGCCGVSLLKAHRLSRGWSARQAIEELEYLCEQQSLGHPRASIDLLNAWENNRARPRPQTIDLLARLYRANAVRLGMAADYCDEAGAGRVVVVAQNESENGVHVEEPADDDTERRAMFHQAMLMGMPNGRFFAEVEGTRHDVDRTLATSSVTEDQLDRLDEQVLRYRREYMTTAPMPMLCRVMLELSDVRRLAVVRQPAIAQRRLLTATTMLSLLSADALMKLGDTRQAHAWYGTARSASDDVGDLRLRALVRAQQTMLLYYYGDLAETVRLAREARMLAGNAPSSPAALAAAAEARALARMGDSKAARTALAEAEQIFARMRGIAQDDLAFVFTEKRMTFYRTGTLIELGDAAAQSPQSLPAGVQAGFQTIDPALILLDQASHLAKHGDHEEACRIAAEALSQVPAEHRTSIVLTRAKALLADADPRLASVRELHRLLAEPRIAGSRDFMPSSEIAKSIR
jgi:tetratricopeptide (TPR) repeat protein